MGSLRQRVQSAAIHGRRRAIHALHQVIRHRTRSMTPEALGQPDEKAVLRAFRNACRAPAYARLLGQRGVDPDRVRDLDSFFRLVPIVDKHSLFQANEMGDLCAGGLDDVALYYSSSGATGTFSYGAERGADAKSQAAATEFALDLHFEALARPTLLINCLPMGVKVHLDHVALAETSVREDVIWSLVTKLRRDFDQFILVGEQMFLKKTVEGGAERGIPWKDLRVHLVTGGEYVAENYRTYLASLLGIDCDDPATGSILINFGISELSISLLTECGATARIRRLAHRDPAFRAKLYGRETTICPTLLQYVPSLSLLENRTDEQGRPKLVVSMIDARRKLPVMRYDTGDIVELASYERIRSILQEAGRTDLLPDLSLPFAIATGKHKGPRTADGTLLSEQQVKEALYAHPEIASRVTGNFRLRGDAGAIRLLVQLAPGMGTGDVALSMLEPHLRQFGAGDVDTEFVAYERFPYGLTHDYERKCKYWEGV